MKPTCSACGSDDFLYRTNTVTGERTYTDCRRCTETHYRHQWCAAPVRNEWTETRELRSEYIEVARRKMEDGE